MNKIDCLKFREVYNSRGSGFQPFDDGRAYGIDKGNWLMDDGCVGTGVGTGVGPYFPGTGTGAGKGYGKSNIFTLSFFTNYFKVGKYEQDRLLRM